MNESRADTDAATPAAPNVPNDSLPGDGVLSMGVVVNARMNKARAAAYNVSPEASATTNALVSVATSNMLAAEATPDALTAADKQIHQRKKPPNYVADLPTTSKY